MTNIEIKDLISVLEEIGSEQHPEIPASLIQKIITAQFSSQDDRTKARHDTQIIIDDYLKTIKV